MISMVYKRCRKKEAKNRKKCLHVVICILYIYDFIIYIEYSICRQPVKKPVDSLHLSPCGNGLKTIKNGLKNLFSRVVLTMCCD